MARPLSSAAKAAIFASSTGEAFLCLLTLEHATLPQPIRVSSDGVATVSRGLTFQAFPFEIDMPEESDGAPPKVRLRVCNVDRVITEAVRNAASSSPIEVTLEVVLASQPGTVEAGPFKFKLREVSYDAVVVEGTLAFEDLLNEPFPADTYSPVDFPGLFS
jgi:hypothetical protein